VGVLVGGVEDNVERLGLDVIFPAFYLTLLVEELRAGGQTIAVVLKAETTFGGSVKAANDLNSLDLLAASL
jgi:predicted branched-subunit amino acid permease